MKDFSAAINEYTKAFPDGEYKLNELMSAHTTLKIGGPVSVMFLPKSREEVCFLLTLCSRLGIKSFLLGNGSNLLFSDEKHEISVINMRFFSNVRADGDIIEADAGATLAKIANEAYTNSLTGLEFAHGIPGTLGGAVYMNAGAYGSEICDVAESVDVFYNDRGVITLSNGECGFGYRKSTFSNEDCVILSARLRLETGDADSIKLRMDELAEKRRMSQPLNFPSAGSTFKRPQTGYAAAMIDGAGLKGFAIGGAQVSEKHAGFVINKGGATFDDFVAVIEHIQNTVLKTTGVLLEPEVKIIR